MFTKGQKAWNSGLNKKTDNRIKMYGLKISLSLKGVPSPFKGKTYEEIHGVGKVDPKRGRPSPLKGRPNGGKGKKLPFKARKSFHKADLSDRLRHSPQYKEWRDSVYKKDNYTCDCGQVGGDLQADHIAPFSYLIEQVRLEYGEEGLYERCLESKELWDIENGKTLCKECHRKTNTYGGHARCYGRVEICGII